MRVSTNKDGASNIEALIEETLRNSEIKPADIITLAIHLEPEDRVQYLNSILALDGMKLAYAGKFSAEVPKTLSELMKATVWDLQTLRTQRETDPLTGVGTRALIEKNNRKPKGKYAVMMMDLDKFKRWNDAYGHNIGDIALKVLGSILRDTLRRTEGYIGRYGGEEFYIELNQTGADNAMLIAEKVRANVEKYGMQRVEKELESKGLKDIYKQMIKDKLTLTISIGVADELQGHMPEKARERADIALYNAKSNGRNQVVKYTPDMTMPKH